MAEDAVDKAIEAFSLKPGKYSHVPEDISGSGLATECLKLDGSCQTRRVRLIGSHGFSDTLYIQLIQNLGLDAEIAQHLTSSYGDRAWEVAASSQGNSPLSPRYPYIENEIRYAVRNEYAQTAEDVLARRTRLSFLDVKAALKALPRVIDIMGEELDWSGERKELEWRSTVYFLESMGLPKELVGITREEVVSGTLDGRELGQNHQIKIQSKGEGLEPEPVQPKFLIQ